MMNSADIEKKSVDLSRPDIIESTNPEKEKQRRCRCEFLARTRYLILVLVTLCLTSVWSNILTFNFTVICMGPQPTDHPSVNQTSSLHPILGRTGTEREKRDVTVNDEVEGTVTPAALNGEAFVATTSKFDYSPTQKTFLIGAVAVGALIAIVPLTFAINHQGARKVFAVVGLLSALATILIPVAAEGGIVPFLILRGIQGFAFTACFPVIGAVTAKWATVKQNAIFISVLTSFLQLAPSVTNPVSGALCTGLGWRSVYYLHGGVSFFFFVLFAIFYQNSPKNHPFVGQTELNKLAVGKANAAAIKKLSRNIPYRSIFKSLAVYAVWIAAFGNFSGTNLVMLYSPTYLNKVMKFPVEKTGLSAALPPLVQFVVKMISGLTSDKVRCFPETLKVKVYNTVAFFCMGAFFIGLAFVPVDDPMVALALLICGTSLLGFNTGGFYKSATLISRHYSHFVMSVVQIMLCITMLLVPIIVGAIAPNDKVDQWKIVWFVYAAILIVTNIVFFFFGKGVAEKWAEDPQIPDTNENGNQQWSIGNYSIAIVPVGNNMEGAQPAFSTDKLDAATAQPSAL